jgi:hypothetical protein
MSTRGVVAAVAHRIVLLSLDRVIEKVVRRVYV